MTSTAHTLTIYVHDQCSVCDYAHETARFVQQHYPQVQVRLVDVAQPNEPVPECVFATPTYLLDGRVWSLGNPSSQQIHAALSRLE